MAKKSSTFERPLSPDVMGRAGQTDFGGLCDKGTLIATDSTRNDKMGWDYHLEFPLPHERGDAPFDSRSKFPDMKVQVKTIWSDRTTVDIELPAAERLARWNYPSFIVIMRMNMDMTYRDIYVIHLLNENLARILKALREAEAKGSLSIKNKTISFSIQHGIKISFDGQELANTLRSAIGDDPNAYMLRKRDQFLNLGFEPRRWAGTFSIMAADEGEILDTFLGLRRAQVSQFKADEVRFGIRLPQIRETGATVEFKPQSRGSCEFVLTSSVGDRKRAIFEAELFVASTMTPRGLWKVRILSPLIELLFSGNEEDASFTIGVMSETRLTLRDSIRICRAQLIIASGPATAFIRVPGTRILGFTLKEALSPENQRALITKLKFLEDLETMLRSLDLRDIELSDDDIYSEAYGIHFVLKSQRHENTITISYKIYPKNNEQELAQLTEGLFASQIRLSQTTLVFWASMRVAAITSADCITLRCTEFSLRDLAVLGTDQTFDEFVAEASDVSGIGLVIKTDTINRSEGPLVVNGGQDDAA